MEPTIQAVNGIDLAVTEEGTGDPVVLIHGFPELAYSWRHQMPALAGAGFRAIAYDQRGYGGSSKPENVEAYALTHLVADTIGSSTRSAFGRRRSSATTGAASSSGRRPSCTRIASSVSSA